jgi:hypothetical protein
MPTDSKDRTADLTLAEIEAEYGLTPILRSENPRHYVKLFAQFAACLRPSDFFMRWLIKKLVDDAWLMDRYLRHKTVGIERQYKNNVDFQVKRIKAQNARREDTASKIAARATEQPTDVAHAVHFEDTFLEGVCDIDELMVRGPSEHDHDRALQQTMEFQESMDKLHNNATARFYRTLDQIDDYSERLGKRLREVHERIVDADYRVLEEPTETATSPVAPAAVNSNSDGDFQKLEETVAPPLAPQAEQTQETTTTPDESAAIQPDRMTE